LPIAVKKRFSARRESMQLTARQREFARIAGWALPVSVILGAVFGHFNSAPNNSVWPYIQGAIAAIVISCTILLLEFAIFSRTRSALARRVPFLLYLALRSLGYLAAILMGLVVSAWLVRESAESEPLIERGGVIFSLVLSLGFNLLYGVNDLLGQGVLFNFVAGRYRRPRIEERVLLFIDMESSTAIADSRRDRLPRFSQPFRRRRHGIDRGAARRYPQIRRR
jgi:adenylate cyclase